LLQYYSRYVTGTEQFRIAFTWIAIAAVNPCTKKLASRIRFFKRKEISDIQKYGLCLDRNSPLHFRVDRAGIIVRARTKEPLAGGLA
jgi:hypothetical protein